MEYRHRSLAVPVVAQSLRAVLHCAAAVKTFPLKKVTIWFVPPPLPPTNHHPFLFGSHCQGQS